jgi:hypothetical protein
METDEVKEEVNKHRQLLFEDMDLDSLEELDPEMDPEEMKRTVKACAWKK